MLSVLLVLAVLLPAAGGVVAGLRGRTTARAAGVVFSGAALVAAGWAMVLAAGSTTREAFGGLPWLPGDAAHLSFGVFLDPLSSVLLLVVTAIGFLTAVFSTRYLSESNREHRVRPGELGRYYFWLLAFLASMVGVAVSPNFLQMFIFWEMTTICSWALIAFYQSEQSLKAAFKALLLTHVGGLFFLTALIVLFVETGSFEFDALSRLPDRLRSVVFLLLIAAAWAKAAQVPMHTWLPAAMEAPTPVSAYLHAAAMVKAGVYLVARAVISGWSVPAAAGWVLGVGALLTIFIALSYYFVQDDLKRLLAYSTIAHLGYVLLGIALGAMGSMTGLRGGVLHLACHGFAKATLFFCAGAVAFTTGSRSIAALGGLARTMPLTAAAFFVGVLATTGVPPFSCFWSKFMILAGAVRLGGAIAPVLLVLVLAESLISFAWMLHVGQKVFLGAATPVAEGSSDPPAAMTGVLIVLMIGCLAAPAPAMPLIHWIGR